jgi:hypothetical protein
MSSTPPPATACTSPAVVVLEGFSPSAEGLVRGSMEKRMYVCADHARAARSTWFSEGLTPFTALGESATGHGCGEVHEFNMPTAQSPEPASRRGRP